MDLRESFALELGRLSRRWRKRLDERLKVTGLTQARWTTLLHLARGGPCMTQRELAEHLGVEGPTVVRLLDALEGQGLIERLPVEGDRRAKHIRLTAAAAPLLGQINRIAAELRGEIFADLKEDDLKTCLMAFRSMADRLERNVT
jgi:MarR family transcriptional regulator for hemolysin